MKPDPLDDLLRSYASQPVPSPGSQDNAEVWRRIAERKQRRGWFTLPILSWRELFAEPRMAVAGLVVALLMGVGPVAAAASSLDTPKKARASLHLQCFAHCPSCLAGTMRPEEMRP